MRQKQALLTTTELALHVIEYGNKNYKLQACYKQMLPGCFASLIFLPLLIYFSPSLSKYAGAVGSFLDHY